MGKHGGWVTHLPTNSLPVNEGDVYVEALFEGLNVKVLVQAATRYGGWCQSRGTDNQGE